MVNKSDDNKHLVNEEAQLNELIKRVTPSAKFICIKFYDETLVKKDLENNGGLGNCDIIEIVTHIPIKTKNLRNLIKKAGYRLFDVIYESDGFHFFVRKVGEKET